MYAGRVEPLPCSLWKYIFDDINLDQAYQVFAGTNERFNEVWWYYCSEDSNIVDKYVIYNYVDNAWYAGNLARTAWLDSPLRDFPQAATTGNMIVFHEAAVDDGSTNPPSPIVSYIQSADFDIGNGDKYGFVYRMIPDITFNGSDAQNAGNPTVSFKMRPRKNPGAAYKASNSPSVTSVQSYDTEKTYEVQEFTELVFTRVRGRQMAFRIESNTLGTQWQLGVPKLDIRMDGGR